MTKQKEIEALTGFIESLPVDSYLRPWLSSVLGEVRYEIESDFSVSPSLLATRRECATLLELAKREAGEIVGRAHKQALESKAAADKFARDASTSAENRLRRTGDALREALRSIEEL